MSQDTSQCSVVIKTEPTRLTLRLNFEHIIIIFLKWNTQFVQKITEN